MKTSTLMLILSIGMLLATAQSCLECGEECKRVCGTKQFKACCFNYLKKRSFPPSGPDLKTLDGNAQLEISLADAVSRRSSGAESQASAPSQFEELMPVAALLAKQGRLVTLTQGRMQIVYDA